jgi:hypothetical protein
MKLGQVATFSRSTAVPSLDTPLTELFWHVVKTVFGNMPGHGRPAKGVWPTSLTLGRLGLGLVPHHPSLPCCP